jgi:hypothetical protein
MSDSGQYATGSPVGDRVFAVSQTGASEWAITDGEAHGCIMGRQSEANPYALFVDESGAEGMVSGSTMWDAVQAFAEATRMVEATPTGRVIASAWQSPGTVGSVLAQFASTGRARLDLLQQDAEATMRQDSVSRPDMSLLLTAGHGWREPVTVRSIAENVVSRGAQSLTRTVATVLARVADEAPYLIDGHAELSRAVDDIATAHENGEDADEEQAPSVPAGDPKSWPL